jgi:hypothetical protein
MWHFTTQQCDTSQRHNNVTLHDTTMWNFTTTKLCDTSQRHNYVTLHNDNVTLHNDTTMWHFTTQLCDTSQRHNYVTLHNDTTMWHFTTQQCDTSQRHNYVTLHNNTTMWLTMWNNNWPFREWHVAVTTDLILSHVNCRQPRWPIHRRCSEVATVATEQILSSSQNVTVGLSLCKNVLLTNSFICLRTERTVRTVRRYCNIHVRMYQ